MPVTPGATPTEVNLNATVPAAPGGETNVEWQAGTPYPDPNNPQRFVRDTSAYMPNVVGDSGSGGASGAVPAPAAGDAAAGKYLKADGTWEVPPPDQLVIGFVMNSGAPGTNVGPELVASRAGQITKCKLVTKTSDGSTDLTFKIKQNGTDVFSADPTVAHGTSAGTVSTFTSLTSSPLPVAADDVFTIDVTSGAADWQFTVQLES